MKQRVAMNLYNCNTLFLHVFCKANTLLSCVLCCPVDRGSFLFVPTTLEFMIWQILLHLSINWCQFHQLFTRAFFIRKCFAQLFHMLFSSCVLAKKAFSYKKRARKMLTKLTQGLTRIIYEFDESLFLSIALLAEI